MGSEGPPMEGIISGLVQLGVGGIMAAALIWFHYHLVSKTIPDLTASFARVREADRAERVRETDALLAMIRQHDDRLRRQHELLMDRLHVGFENVVLEVMENRAPRQAQSQPRPRRRPPEEADRADRQDKPEGGA